MEFLDIFRQFFSWIHVIGECIALYIVLTWPDVKGKTCLICSLLILVLVGFYYRCFELLDRYGDNELISKIFESTKYVNMLIDFMMLISSVLLIISLIQLRSYFYESRSQHSLRPDQE